MHSGTRLSYWLLRSLGKRKYEEKLVGCGGWGEAAGGGRAWGFRRNGAGDAGVLVIFSWIWSEASLYVFRYYTYFNFQTYPISKPRHCH
jgi:hypothetical protein